MVNEINATDLVGWADTIEARGLLPELIGRLVAVSVNEKELIENSFATREGTNSGGWDGHTETKIAHTYVLMGIAGWEMGCDKDKRGKADSDYASRVKAIQKKERSKTNFVFVTPRRWRDKTKWVKGKSELKEWKSVKALDGDDVIKWCLQHPSVMLWLQEKVKGESGTSVSAYDEWHRAAASLKIKLPPKLLLAGREDETKELAAALTGGSRFSSIVHSQSAMESKLFILSVINTLPQPIREAIINKTVIVETEEAYLKLIKHPNNLIIIPIYDSSPPNVGLGSEAGHTIIVPQGKTKVPGANVINLKPLDVDVAANALKGSYDDFNEAYEMARLCKVSCVAFIRRSSEYPELRKSKWAKSREDGPELIPVLLVGAWKDNNEQDKKVLEELSGMPYNKYVERLQSWSLDEDPPVLRLGNTWRVVDRHDANLVITSFITEAQYKKFEEKYREVLSSEDPSYDLPPDERWLANIKGYTQPFSIELSKGMTETLAILVSTNEGGGVEGYASYQVSADVLIRNILSKANDDQTGKKWYSLQGMLTIIAETSPDIFVTYVEKALKASDSVLKKMFVSDNDMFTTSPHTGLLFALETLAWNKEYLPRIALCFAGLHELDPGIKVNNTPFNSLHKLLSVVHPQSTLTQKERMEILDLIIKKYPETGRKLALKLIPDNHEFYIETHPPTFRKSWPIERVGSITYAEMYENITALIDRLLKLYEANPDKWNEIIDILTQLPPDDFDRVLDALKAADKNAIPESTKMAMWSSMRKIIHRHREFPDAKWSYSSEQINALEKVYETFTPEDKIKSLAWLFDRHDVHILNPDGHDWESNRKIAAQLQEDAIKRVYKEDGLKGAYDLAQSVEDPSVVGFSLPKLSKVAEKKIFNYLKNRDEVGKEFARGYIFNQARTRGVEIVSSAFDANKGWSNEQKAALLKSAPSSRALWDIVASQVPEIQSEYWSSATPYGLGAEFDDYIYAAEKLYEFGRPYEALVAINYANKKDDVSSKMMVDVLNEVANTSSKDTQVSHDMIGYYVEETIKLLSDREDVQQSDLVSLQIRYFPLLRESRGESTRELQNRFSEDPELFIELLTYFYHANSGPKTEPSEESQKKAELAHGIIEGMHTLPGTKEDGSIEYDELKSWIDRVCEKLIEVDRVAVGEHELGQFVYRAAKAQKSEKMLSDEVCRLLDEIDSDRFEEGFVMQAFNYGGPVLISKENTVHLDGAAEAEKRASEISTTYPQAARILRKVAGTLVSKQKSLFKGD